MIFYHQNQRHFSTAPCVPLALHFQSYTLKKLMFPRILVLAFLYRYPFNGKSYQFLSFNYHRSVAVSNFFFFLALSSFLNSKGVLPTVSWAPIFGYIQEYSKETYLIILIIPHTMHQYICFSHSIPFQFKILPATQLSKLESHLSSLIFNIESDTNPYHFGMAYEMFFK